MPTAARPHPQAISTQGEAVSGLDPRGYRASVRDRSKLIHLGGGLAGQKRDRYAAASSVHAVVDGHAVMLLAAEHDQSIEQGEHPAIAGVLLQHASCGR